jgi:hypothetical protein
MVLLLLPLMFFSETSYSQSRKYRQFNTQVVRRETLSKYKDYAEKVKGLDNRVSEFVSKADDNRGYRIPIIFHLLSSDGQRSPDESQVQFQLDVLNKCFGRYEPEKKPYTNESIEQFEKLGADPGIQFYVPASVGGGKGINLVKTDKKKFGLGNEMQNPAVGGVAAINPKKAINIWVGELDSTNAGYAHLPGAPDELDGIVIDPDFFGNEKGTAKAPYTQGKTLVHLMGTYLGLNELWDENTPCADDGVADTPPHNAPSVQISKEAGHKYITMCHGYILAMYMNFMDNSDDEMLTLFTPGQKARMRAMLAEGGLRSELSTK